MRKMMRKSDSKHSQETPEEEPEAPSQGGCQT